jgi:simple sugar transport system substrate-binding protein
VPAIEGLSTADLTRDVPLATFDLSPEVLDALEEKRLIFAVDQQPFLQGYLPVLFLAQRARYGLSPPRERLVGTGPSFVTEREAARVRELIRQGIR